MDRGPSHPEYCLAKPWTARYYVLFRHRPKWFLNILINHIFNDDHGEGSYNHPFPYITIILKGGYYETDQHNIRKWRGQFYVGFRSAVNLHRVDLSLEPMLLHYLSQACGFRKIVEVTMVSQGFA